MTIKQLKEQLIGIPDDALIVVRGYDHFYNEAAVESTTAVKDLKTGEIYEYYPEDRVRKHEKQINVVLISTL